MAMVTYRPDVYIGPRRPSARTSLVKTWIWAGEEDDKRCESDLDQVWDDIRDITGGLNGRNKYRNIGLLNFNSSEIGRWKLLIPDVNHVSLDLDYASENVTWDTLYPEWIDEEEESEIPICPELPKPTDPGVRLDIVAVELPCRNERNWSRDVARLHLQLAAATIASTAKGKYPIHVLFVTRCFPVLNLFPCKDLVVRNGHGWLYRPNVDILRETLRLQVGSCELALPLRVEGIARSYTGNPSREAYATVLHSAHVYVCGAIAAAQSIRMTGLRLDLVILVDEANTSYHRSRLEAAGRKIHTIKKIRNPKAEKDLYNEWNYSKFRLWQLTDYDKIIFIDADWCCGT